MLKNTGLIMLFSFLLYIESQFIKGALIFYLLLFTTFIFQRKIMHNLLFKMLKTSTHKMSEALLTLILLQFFFQQAKNISKFNFSSFSSPVDTNCKLLLHIFQMQNSLFKRSLKLSSGQNRAFSLTSLCL